MNTEYDFYLQKNISVNGVYWKWSYWWSKIKIRGTITIRVVKLFKNK